MLKMYKDQNLVDRMHQGEDYVVELIYKKYRAPFLKWAIKNHDLGTEEAKNILQESIITLYINVTDKKLVNLKSSLFTYLCGIGKNKIREERRAESKNVYYSDNWMLLHVEDVDTLEELQEKERMFMQVEWALKEVGERCKKMIDLFYFNKKSLKEISGVMGYSNENSAKTAKLKCVNRIKSILATSTKM